MLQFFMFTIKISIGFLHKCADKETMCEKTKEKTAFLEQEIFSLQNKIRTLVENRIMFDIENQEAKTENSKKDSKGITDLKKQIMVFEEQIIVLEREINYLAKKNLGYYTKE